MKVTTDEVIQAYQLHGGSIRAAAQSLQVDRKTVRYHLDKAGIDRNKKLADGKTKGIEAVACDLPKKSKIRRYILTSAQNNTHLNMPVWNNLKALAKHYDAEILVGTFTYNKSAYGPLSVKRGTMQPGDAKTNSLWYAPELTPHLCDERLDLAPSLHWCGEMNILPTAVNPLSGFETYTGAASSILPQVKFAMRSIATPKNEPTKFLYTTGTVTMRNYIQKREGMKAEHHHCYGGLLVEVNHEGGWWVRQLNATEEGVIYDLDIFVENEEVKKHMGVAGITWGDSHALLLDPAVLKCSHAMLDELKPSAQFVNDIMLGSVTNHHESKSLHERFRRHVKRGAWCDLRQEMRECIQFLQDIYRPGCQTYVVDSNHDRPWIERWLDRTDGREDPKNALLWLELNVAMYKAMELDPFKKDFHIMAHAFRELGLDPIEAQFLMVDESVKITDAEIECGQHGHLGPNGTWGSVNNLSKLPRKFNIGHCHKAGIYNGLYAAGVSCETDAESWYTKGPHSWSHSHIVTYPNGKRTIITLWDGKHRA